MQNQFTPGSESVALDDVVIVIGYDSIGNPCNPNAQECMAKRAYDPSTQKTNYWAKRGTKGREAGCLYNPQSPTFNGRDEYLFKKVNEECFGLFVQFLQTGNVSYVRNAERCSS